MILACLSVYLSITLKHREMHSVCHHRPATVIVNNRVLSDGGAHLLQMAWLHGKRAPLETKKKKKEAMGANERK